MTVEITVVVAIVAAAVVALVGLVVWRKVSLKQAEAAVKQEAVRKGLSVADIQHLMELPTAVSPYERVDVGRVARELAVAGVSGAELEQAMALVQGSDSPTRLTIAQAFFQMVNAFGHKPDKEQLLAVIRGCCGAARSKGDVEGDTSASSSQPDAATDGGRESRFSEFHVAQPGRR